MELLAFAAGIGILWIIGSFYWLRIIATAAGLAAWGTFAVAAPLYLIAKAMDDGRIAGAIITLIVCLPIAGLWLAAAHFAREWLSRERKAGRLNQPWNSR